MYLVIFLMWQFVYQRLHRGKEESVSRCQHTHHHHRCRALRLFALGGIWVREVTLVLSRLDSSLARYFLPKD